MLFSRVTYTHLVCSRLFYTAEIIILPQSKKGKGNKYMESSLQVNCK